MQITDVTRLTASARSLPTVRARTHAISVAEEAALHLIDVLGADAPVGLCRARVALSRARLAKASAQREHLDQALEQLLRAFLA